IDRGSPYCAENAPPAAEDLVPSGQFGVFILVAVIHPYLPRLIRGLLAQLFLDVEPYALVNEGVSRNLAHVEFVTADNSCLAGKFVKRLDAVHRNSTDSLFERVAAVDELEVLDPLQFRIERFLAHVRIIFQDQFIGLAAVAIEKIGPALDGSADETLYEIGILFDQVLTGSDRVAVSAVAIIGDEVGRDLRTFLLGIDRFRSSISLLHDLLVAKKLGEAVIIGTKLFVLEAELLHQARPEGKLRILAHQHGRRTGEVLAVLVL